MITTNQDNNNETTTITTTITMTRKQYIEFYEKSTKKKKLANKYFWIFGTFCIIASNRTPHEVEWSPIRLFFLD